MVLRAKHTEYRDIEKTGGRMGYRYLGNTGLKVSILSYGNWVNADAGDEASAKLMNDTALKCWDAGMNFFDTAEIYAMGSAESQLGNTLKYLEKERNLERKDYVVSTKLIAVGFDSPNDKGLSRKHIIEGARNSLKRLQLDYVDVIFAHRPDYDTPLEEQVRAFSWLIDNGLALYWGTSEWTGQMFEEACQIADRLRLHKPCVE